MSIQAKYHGMTDYTGRALPLGCAPCYAHEVVGLEAVAQLAAGCFGPSDPGESFYRGILQEIVDTGDGGYVLRLPIPFIDRDDVRLRKRGDELFITIGNFKREMILPTVLAKRRAGGGRLRDGMLEISFLPGEVGATAEPV